MREAEMLKEGKIGVIPTDTLYGVVAAALNEGAVKRVYALKRRKATKPSIILIASPTDLALFNIVLTEELQKLLSKYWPGPVSVVLPCGAEVPEYLHGSTHTLAFRMPKDIQLSRLLRESGPLIAPSANPEGLPPATTVEDARKYFGDNVDFYIDGGTHAGKPSTIISFGAGDSVVTVRGRLGTL